MVVVAAPHLTPLLHAIYYCSAYCAISYLAVFNDCDDLTRAHLGYCISNAKEYGECNDYFFHFFLLDLAATMPTSCSGSLLRASNIASAIL